MAKVLYIIMAGVKYVFKEVFVGRMPVELRDIERSAEVGAVEVIDFRVLLLGTLENAREVKIELTSEVDLFFHYTHIRNARSFMEGKGKEINLRIGEYPQLLERLVRSVERATGEYLAVFYMDSRGAARLDFVQNVNYRFVELLTCDFQVSPDADVRKSVTRRYKSQRSSFNIVLEELTETESIVKRKSPGLMISLTKKSQNLSNTPSISH